jgi:hypothetical protein
LSSTEHTKWFFAEIHSRNITPSSRLSTQEYVERRLAENTLSSLEKVLLLSPTNSVALDRLVLLALRAGKVSQRTLAWVEWQLQRRGTEGSEQREGLVARALLERLKEDRRLRSQPARSVDPGTALRVPVHYPTIQAAVDAAQPGDTVRIAAGDYFEQAVIVGKTNLTIVGEPGAILHATTEMEQTLLRHSGTAITILGIVRSDVTVRGLDFEGHRLADFHGGLIGLVFRGSGGRVENCAFRGFRGVEGELPNQPRGVNIYNPLFDGTGSVNVGIHNSTFSDNQIAIVIGGDYDTNLLRIVFSIEGNTIDGLGGSARITSHGVVIHEVLVEL